MSREFVTYVCIPDSLIETILQLAQRAKSSLLRNTKLPPGDRTEAVRFENLHTTIDQIATAVMLNQDAQFVTSDDADLARIVSQKRGISVLDIENSEDEKLPSKVRNWLNAGGLVVELLLPHGSGTEEINATDGAPPIAPAKRWKSSAKSVRAAIKERFEDSVVSAFQNQASNSALSPSGVSNRVLTETLHEYSQVQKNYSRRDVPVVYRDGSRGPHFPLGALKMCDPSFLDARTLRFTLLSIRHVEMDSLVDGAWLRNTRISRTREAGLTDRIVFEQSRRQLNALDPNIPTIIEMYQTGLETAIIGFYRAVILHLLDHPGSVAVQPMFFIGNNRFEPSTRIWVA